MTIACKLAGHILGAAALLGLLAAEARADAIDGEWCREGRNFKIDGPNIQTYGGTYMQGHYSRHDFRYTVPQSEPEAGTEIAMVLRSEEALDLYRKPRGGAAQGAPERWQRCRVTS